MYVITGASGNTGKRIAERLLVDGKKVRVIGRSVERLQEIVGNGAEARIGSMDDANFLTDSFRGATAVYAMIPADLQAENLRDHQNRIGEALATALQEAEVEYIVFLSSLGAHLPERTGPVLGLYDQEQRLNKLGGANIVYLRPTFFMENHLHNIPMIKELGMNGTALIGDLEFPVIATQDIARVAGDYLLKLDFTGISVRELLGPKDLSMNEMTQIIGKAIGKEDLRYMQFSYEEARNGMIEQGGLPPDVARSLVELYESINNGLFSESVTRTPENTTETTFEEFAETFAVIYHNR